MKLDKLDIEKVDTCTAISKGFVGVIPIAGPLLAEIVGTLIPNQRLDRICNFLRELEKRLTKVELGKLKQNNLALELFEDAAAVASRSLTEERNKYVVSFMKSVVAIDDTEYDIKKKLLYILQDLTDRDIEILQSIQVRGYQVTASENHLNSFTIAELSQLTEKEKNSCNARQEVWPLHISTLERNGLLKAYREEQDTDNRNLHIDLETGLPRISSYEISKLGDVFLFSISDEDDG